MDWCKWLRSNVKRLWHMRCFILWNMKIISLLTILAVLLLGGGCVTLDQPDVAKVVVPEAAVESARDDDVKQVQGAGDYLLPERNNKIDFRNSPGRDEDGFSIWRSFGATLCILGALVALNLYIRKGRFSRMGLGNKRIKFVEKHALDQKKSLMLFEVDGRTVLVGVGGESVSRIMELDDQDFGEELGGQIVEAGEVKGIEE